MFRLPMWNVSMMERLRRMKPTVPRHRSRQAKVRVLRRLGPIVGNIQLDGADRQVLPADGKM